MSGKLSTISVLKALDNSPEIPILEFISLCKSTSFCNMSAPPLITPCNAVCNTVLPNVSRLSLKLPFPNKPPSLKIDFKLPSIPLIIVSNCIKSPPIPSVARYDLTLLVKFCIFFALVKLIPSLDEVDVLTLFCSFS